MLSIQEEELEISAAEATSLYINTGSHSRLPQDSVFIWKLIKTSFRAFSGKVAYTKQGVRDIGQVDSTTLREKAEEI